MAGFPSFSSAGINDFAGAASSIFGGEQQSEADQIKAQGDFAEATSYQEAAALAKLNESYTQTATAVKEMQNQREIYQTISQQKEGVAAGGLAESGSAIDLLRSSASQGALSQAIIGGQGLITEAGYNEQQQSYTNMAQAAIAAGQAEENMASQSSTFGDITGAIKGAAGIATLFGL